ncbi:MAG: 3-deoxy-8-phosphooctulonate synthase [Spirochaetes bacterium]|nr:3-deoxy-8-phosphooctulonate synthase [Spirochaetota bacterium]
MRFNYKGITNDNGSLFLIAGPCVIESEQMTMRIADSLAGLQQKTGMRVVFKASYDKANRTSKGSFRGMGIEEGLRILQKAREATGLPVLTDVHSAQEATAAGQAVDIVQIPAFLCRQTDILRAACETKRAVNVKKGQFASGEDTRYIVEKCSDALKEERLLLTERGNSFGYNNLVVDMRNLVIMRRLAPVVFDATHSVQLPSSGGGVSGGGREFIPALLRAAVAAGIDGIFMEVHPEPEKGLSDAATMFPLDKLEKLIITVRDLNVMIKGTRGDNVL